MMVVNVVFVIDTPMAWANSVATDPREQFQVDAVIIHTPDLRRRYSRKDSDFPNPADPTIRPILPYLCAMPQTVKTSCDWWVLTNPGDI